ncbi:hypothetical protein [Halomarina oriensis]|uniref:Uncharacterized protein n=1 Tax=Halomarina oriensis TaxID=671145 RepID=A0A6B0GMI7_9EURY|nr:hypothetical protein [Halomarina oriensis]MWG36126.1 hypothetical protein [Halomarina oriensis]
MTQVARQFGAVVAGSVVIATGSAVVGLMAFDGSVGWVTLGFALFVLGYALSQRGADSGVPTRPSGDRRAVEVVVRGGLVVGGVVGIAWGVTQFSLTVLDPSLTRAAVAGVSSIGGYIVAHVGVNRDGLGGSFFEPLLDSVRGVGRSPATEEDISRLQWAGFGAGMLLTSASLSSGFIWACGTRCIEDAVVWSPGRQGALIFAAAFAGWWGYLVAHRSVAGNWVDQSAHGPGASATRDGTSDTTTADSLSTVRLLGVVLGLGVLVAGMVVGVFYIRQGDHLLTNVGGVLFLSGYAIAHHLETGLPL